MIRKIAVDLDDVLANFVEAWNMWLYETGLSDHVLSKEEITSFDYHEKRFGKEALNFYLKGNCYDNMEPLNGALFFLEWCQENFDEVMILSHCANANSRKCKKEFVKKHFDFDNIQFSDTKHKKYMFTKDSILVDDYPINLLDHSINNLSPSILLNHGGKNGWSDYLNHPDIVRGLKPDVTQNCYIAKSFDDVKHLLSLIKDEE